MELPHLTGPDDTQFAFSIMCIAAGMIGPEFFGRDLGFTIFGYDEIRISHATLYLILILEVPTTIHNVLSSLNKSQNEEHFKSRYNAWTMVLHLSFIPILDCIWAAYCSVPGSKAYSDYYFLMYMSLGLNFCKQSTGCWCAMSRAPLTIPSGALTSLFGAC